MRCAICDKALSEKEISFNKDLDQYEPCVTCLDIALEAAYEGGKALEDQEDYLFAIPEEYDSEDLSDYNNLTYDKEGYVG